MNSARAVLIARSRLFAHKKRTAYEIQVGRAIRRGESRATSDGSGGNQISRMVVRREGSGGRRFTTKLGDALTTSRSPIGMGQGSVRMIENARSSSVTD